MPTNFKHEDANLKRQRPKNRVVAKARAAKRRRLEAEKKRVYALVDARDKGFCRATGIFCGSFAHRHHIVYRSRGGEHTTANVVTLRSIVHDRIHSGHLVVTGNADETLRFRDTVSGHEWESPRPCL